MIQVRKAQARGHANFGWLNSHHTFSFGSYYDPEHMGFRKLRVINEDRVKAGMGFGEHPHADMEILSYVVDGALAHKDNIGNHAVIRPGEIQRMSAGSGIRHSEFNHSRTDTVHFLQIWIETDKPGMQPSYEQTYFADKLQDGEWLLIASADGREDSIRVFQDMALYAARWSKGQTNQLNLAPGRHAWVQVVKGAAAINGHPLNTSDGAAISDETRLTLTATTDAEILVFDLA